MIILKRLPHGDYFCSGLGPLFTVSGDFLQGFAQIIAVRNIVSFENRIRKPTAGTHGDGLIAAAANKVAGGGAPKIMKEFPRTFCESASRSPRFVKPANRAAVAAMENELGDFRYAIIFEATRRCPPFEQFSQFAFDGHLERLAVFDKLAGEPRACSGDIYAIVPIVAP